MVLRDEHSGNRDLGLMIDDLILVIMEVSGAIHSSANHSPGCAHLEYQKWGPSVS